MKNSIVLTVSFTFLLGTGVRAQSSVRLTLEEAITRGLQASHRLAELEAKRTAARSVVDVRRAADRPLVSLEAGYTRTNHIDEFLLPNPAAGGRLVNLYADVPDNLRTRLDLQWPIYTGGRTDALERAARAEADALGQDRQAAQADLKFEITRAYWSVVTAGASLKVLEQALARMDAHLTDARNRQLAGLAPPTDVMSAEARRSRQQMLLIEARNLQEASTADLRRLVGLPSDATIDIDSTLSPPSVTATPPATLVEEARTKRADRHALETRIQGAGDVAAAAHAGKRPTLALVGGYDYARPNARIFPRASEWNTSWDVGVNLNWSLWDGGRVKADVAQAVANRHAAEEGLREFDSLLESSVRQERLNLESSLAVITAAEDAVRSATEARRVVAERYAAGVATNTDALDLQLALVQAELDRTRAIANSHLAAARLDRALGR